jgi:hypothetical protein
MPLYTHCNGKGRICMIEVLDKDGVYELLHITLEALDNQLQFEILPYSKISDSILFNEPLTKMIINSLLTSSAYDAIKFVVFYFWGKLKDVFRIRSDSKGKVIQKNIPCLDFRLKIGNAEVNVLVSSNFTHKQSLEYIDKAFEMMIDLRKTNIP